MTEVTAPIHDTHFSVPDLMVRDLAIAIQGRYAGLNNPAYLYMERKIAWEYLPDDLEPRRVEQTLTAGAIELPLLEVFYLV